MNESFIAAALSACWLGILTSISPCPLATNIAAISFIGKRLDRPRTVLAAGLLYTLGRTLSYVIVGGLIIASILAVPKLSFFLQENMNKILGPILIIVGLFLVGILNFNLPGVGFGAKLQEKVERYGLWGAGILGLLFALSFCPISAALFFGSLIPIALDHQSSVLMPTLYGIGTALPVVVFALIIAFSARILGKAFDRITQFSLYAKRVTGAVFILVGIYYTLSFIFELQLY